MSWCFGLWAAGALSACVGVAFALEPPEANGAPQALQQSATQLRQLEQRREQQRQELRRVLTDRKQIQRALVTLQAKINEKQRELQVFESDLSSHQGEQAEFQSQLERAKQAAEQVRRRVRRRLRQLYKDYTLGVLRPIRSSYDAAAWLRHSRYHAAFAAADLKLFGRYQETQAQLEGLHTKLALRSRDIEVLRQQAAATVQELVKLRATKEEMLIDLIDQRALLFAEIQDLESEVNQLRAVLNRQREERLAADHHVQSRSESASLLSSPGDPLVGPARTLPNFEALKGELPWPAGGKIERLRPAARTGKRRRGPRGLRIHISGAPEVRSVERGEVVFADHLGGFGNLLIIHHGNSYYTLYGQLGEILVTVGDWVHRLQQIAVAEQRLASARPTVYFEIRHHGSPEDPFHWLTRKSPS